MNSVRKDLGFIQGILSLYIVVYGVCVIVWSKDLFLYLIYNIQPSKFSIVLSILITITAMVELLVKNLKELSGYVKTSR